MIQGRRVLAVVPARGGSKGIPLKNLKPIRGRPMVALVGDVVAQVPEIDRAVVSTDHDEIACVANEAGLAAFFRRPPEISGDRIGDFEVLLNALEEAERYDACRYDIVVMLQPTSPIRSPAEVSGTIRMLVNGNWDSVWTVSETDLKAHPLKQLTIGPDGRLGYYDERGGQIIARQQLTPLYHRNGVAYAMTRDCLIVQRTIKGRRTAAYLLEGDRVSIDTQEDIDRVELIIGLTESGTGR
jgi:CMP-N,N'-diacetyllegionaminic acid synthase